MNEPTQDSTGFSLALATKEADRRWNEASEHLKYATEYAQAGLKGLFLANGAAIVALLTLLGNSKDLRIGPTELWWSFVCYSLGLAAVLLANILGYFSQAAAMQACLQLSWQADSIAHATGQIFEPRKHERIANCAENIGIILAMASLIGFVVGSFLALSAIT